MVQERVKEALANEKSRHEREQKMQFDERSRIEDANSKKISDLLADYKKEFQTLNRDMELKDKKIKELSNNSTKFEMDRKLKEDTISSQVK